MKEHALIGSGLSLALGSKAPLMLRAVHGLVGLVWCVAVFTGHNKLLENGIVRGIVLV